MKLTKFGILVNKTTYLFTSIRDNKISRGCAKSLEIPEGRGGGKFWGPILENPEGRGVIRQIPSRGGGYGYFLEPHNDGPSRCVVFTEKILELRRVQFRIKNDR